MQKTTAFSGWVGWDDCPRLALLVRVVCKSHFLPPPPPGFSHHSRADFIASSFSLSLSLAAAFKTEGPGWHVNTAYHGGSVSFGWVETISRGPNGRGRRGRK